MLKELLEQFHSSQGDTEEIKEQIYSSKEYMEHVLEDPFRFHKNKKELMKHLKNITYLQPFKDHDEDEYTKGWMFDLNGTSYTVGMMTYRSTTDYFFLNEGHDEYYDDKKSFNMWKINDEIFNYEDDDFKEKEPHKIIACFLQQNVNPEFNEIEDMYL